MSSTQFQIAQAAQHRVPGGLIALYGVDSVDAVLTAELGISTPTERHSVSIPVGGGAPIAGLGIIEVLDARVAGEGGRSHVLLRFTPSGEGGDA